MIDPRAVHAAMQDAPVDDQLYRQARAAIAAIEARYTLVPRASAAPASGWHPCHDGRCIARGNHGCHDHSACPR